MSYTTIFTSDYGNTISVRRNDQYLTIRSESPINSEPVYIYIPHDEADDFLNRFDRVANAPAWADARFIELRPGSEDIYCMARVDDETWVDQYGQTFTETEMIDEFLGVDIRVIA